MGVSVSFFKLTACMQCEVQWDIYVMYRVTGGVKYGASCGEEVQPVLSTVMCNFSFEDVFVLQLS